MFCPCFLQLVQPALQHITAQHPAGIQAVCRLQDAAGIFCRFIMQTLKIPLDPAIIFIGDLCFINIDPSSVNITRYKSMLTTGIIYQQQMQVVPLPSAYFADQYIIRAFCITAADRHGIALPRANIGSQHKSTSVTIQRPGL